MSAGALWLGRLCCEEPGGSLQGGMSAVAARVRELWQPLAERPNLRALLLGQAHPECFTGSPPDNSLGEQSETESRTFTCVTDQGSMK